MPRRLYYPLALLAAVALGGCDTENPSTPLEEVEGVYAFTELYFDTQASAIADADVLARLDSAQSDIEIFSNAPALIRFELDGEGRQRADASVTATPSIVRLTAVTEADARTLSEILLPPTMTFDRDEDGDHLVGEFFLPAADLEAFDPDAYAGVPPVAGTLFVTLQRVD
jgi:hypothetical protein